MSVDAMFLVAEKALKIEALNSRHEQRLVGELEGRKATVRAGVAHPFRVIRGRLGYRHVRYHSIAMNAARVLRLVAPSNLWTTRQRLLLAAWSARLPDGEPLRRRGNTWNPGAGLPRFRLSRRKIADGWWIVQTLPKAAARP